MILIIDFGSQTAHLIGRRLRQLGVKIEYADGENAMEDISRLKPSGIILSGGPSSVYEPEAPTVDEKIFALKIPVFGICYGWQLMAKLLGGEVKSALKEYGPEVIKYRQDAFGVKEKSHQVVMSHGDSVTKLPAGFEIIASTDNVQNAAVVNAQDQLFGVQFHPEVDHTEYGLEILRYFVEKVCHEKISEFKLDPHQIIADMKAQAGSKKVIFAVSGGVDSTVAAFLLGKAIGKNLLPVYVESGLMRPNTRERVEHLFTELVEADLVVVEARERFMKTLKGITDPEKKRKTIGKLYVDIFQEEIGKHQGVDFLGQGTIYSDVIESKGSKKASHIKSHHNVGGLPKDMKLQLIEPVRYFYKDEVRELGSMVGLSEEVVRQEPFPGPGYAVRIRGEVTEKRLQQVQMADTIVVEEMKKAGLYYQMFHAFALMTGAFSTAVKGDARAFAEVVAIRIIQSKDIMTATWADIPYEVMKKMSSRIVNEVPDVSRVVYDVTTKPPATTEWE